MKPKQKKKFKKNLIFLFIVLIIYLLLGILDYQKTLASFKNSLNIFLTVIPIFAIVIGFLTVINLIPNKYIKKVIGEKSTILSWIVSVFGGIFSHGPIYMWYSFLTEMEKKGMSRGKIVTFLYARAIKIPLLPLMISFFGLPFTIIYNVYLFIFSIFQGILIDFFFKKYVK